MRSDQKPSYRPIRDYALIGDAHTAALVATDGSIDWCCWPQFDSPAVFCRILDAKKGGCFQISPSDPYSVSRSYVDATNVLVTTFTTSRGQVRVTDLMPIQRQSATRRGCEIGSLRRILRVVEGIGGQVEMRVYFRPTFDFARSQTTLTLCQGGAIARGGTDRLVLKCPWQLQSESSGALVSTAFVSAGDRIPISASYTADNDSTSRPLPDVDAEAELAHTLDYWREWSEVCGYRGPYHDLVRRSALTLKLLTFEPTGALVAAPTTSLPENIGGMRNWDYRYTWLRDSSLILDALMGIGYHDEAIDFFDWLDSTCVGCCDGVQSLYTVNGGRNIPEQALDHLDGYRGSRPVRIGNAASEQTQLDVYGEVLDAAHFCFERMPRPINPELWAVLRHLADQAAARWQEPDSGIWEVRTTPQHFLYSKLLCWVALDRAVKLAERAGMVGNTDHWRRTRERIRQAVLAEGFDSKLGAFTRAFGNTALDASALVIPLIGFLPPTDPRVRSTVHRIRERLTAHGLVYRYLTDDGLFGGEATFALCSFWLVDNLALSGQVDEAHALFETITRYANDVGLFAEEIDPASGELLGNHPQGFTHLALIRSALNIARAETRGAEEYPKTPAERAGEMER
jgi:GH15 family glucan-1,4-alpha-glucosidase